MNDMVNEDLMNTLGGLMAQLEAQGGQAWSRAASKPKQLTEKLEACIQNCSQVFDEEKDGVKQQTVT